LVSTKTGRQETREELTARIREASGFFPLDRLSLSPQCGFSSSIVGNRISMEDQKRKLRVLVKTAEAIWA
jgi:5-methyltetrahydropteroyltriglutamate--homocysteine methyltransferase